MDKVTKKNATHKETGQISGKVKQALTDILQAIPPQAAESKPAVQIARLITTTATEQGNPFTLNGHNVCMLIDGKKCTLSKEVITWLIEAIATKLRVKGLPFDELTAKAYYLQFTHTVRLDFFTNKTAA